MLDLTINSSPKIVSTKTTYSSQIIRKCEAALFKESDTEKEPSINIPEKSNIDSNIIGEFNNQCRDKYSLSPTQSLISKSLLNTPLPFMHPFQSTSVDTNSQNFPLSPDKMNENILPQSIAAAKALGVAMAASKPMPSNSSPSSLKLLPKKFSPFSVDSLLSHKEKQAACEQNTGDDEFLKDPIDIKNFDNKKSSTIPEHIASNLSALGSSAPQDLRSTRLSQDSMEVGHHLSVAKFLLNNNLHDRSISDNISRIHCENIENNSESKQKYIERPDSKKFNPRDSAELPKRLQERERDIVNAENGSSNENDIDVCGDDADMDDEDHDYRDDINDIKSENNYQHMMSDEDVSADEDNEHNDFVKTEDIEDEKLELDRQMHYTTSEHKLNSRSDLSPKQSPMLSPRFPLGFPITSASPNPFSPPSPSSGIAGSTLPRPTPSMPWLPQLRSPLQLPGFIGSKFL